MADVRYARDPKSPRPLSADETAGLDALTAEEIERNAAEDPDNQPLSEVELARVAFARQVRQAREASGLTQEAFGQPLQDRLGTAARLGAGALPPRQRVSRIYHDDPART